MPSLEQLRALLRDDPDDPFLHFGLAMELHKEGQAEGALEEFERVNELDPDHAAAHQQRAGVLMDLGRKGDAIAALEAGIEAADRQGDRHAADDMSRMLSAMRAE